MDVSGVVLRQLPCLSGTGIDTQSSKLSFSSSKNIGALSVLSNGGNLNSKISLRSRKSCGVTRYGFSDGGHVEYYCLSPKAGMGIKKEKKKKEISEKASLKKKLKLVKGMSKHLLRFSSMGFGIEDSEDSLLGEIKGKKISEATEILLSQLQQLKAEEKELKRKKKEEKAKLKAIAHMNTDKVCESSSSSSSESSDSECGEVVNMNSLRNQVIVEPKIDEPAHEFEFEVPKTIIQDQNRSMLEGVVDRNVSNESCSSSSSSSVMVATTAEKIEVCMGGKCKKSGAIALLEEFQQRVGLEGAVVGCKCMGKCRDGPNVRIVKQCNEIEIIDNVGVDRSQTSNNKNPALCIGVGLEDVSVIVGNFFGQEDRKDMGLIVA